MDKKFWVDGVLVKHEIDDHDDITDLGIHAQHTWPVILRPMKLLARGGDRGLGDIIERTIGPVGGNAYKAWYLAAFGKSCGCTQRADRLNEIYPLN